MNQGVRRRSACVRNAPALELKRRREEARSDSGSDIEDADGCLELSSAAALHASAASPGECQLDARRGGVLVRGGAAAVSRAQRASRNRFIS